MASIPSTSSWKGGFRMCCELHLSYRSPDGSYTLETTKQNSGMRAVGSSSTACSIHSPFLAVVRPAAVDGKLCAVSWLRDALGKGKLEQRERRNVWAIGSLIVKDGALVQQQLYSKIVSEIVLNPAMKRRDWHPSEYEDEVREFVAVGCGDYELWCDAGV